MIVGNNPNIIIFAPWLLRIPLPRTQHINTPDNTQETYFDFTEENYKLVNKILSKYPANYKQSGIIPLLDLAQRQHGGWLPVAAMDKVASIVEAAPSRVYEVA